MDDTPQVSNNVEALEGLVSGPGSTGLRADGLCG
jgi:hypothetical protein